MSGPDADAIAASDREAAFVDVAPGVRAASARALGDRAAVMLIVALSFLSLLGPFLLASVPPLTDYPNHLARYWLIAGGQSDPSLRPFYRVDWTNAVTNLGVDRAISLLSPLATAMTLGQAAAVTAAVLPPLGVLALNVAVWRRLTPWQAVFPVAAWSTTLLMGFLNFQIGLGLALVFAALDPMVHPRWSRWWVLIRIPFGLILAVDHMFALLFYAVLLAGIGLGGAPLGGDTVRTLAQRLWRAARSSVWCLIALALIVSHRHVLPGAQTPGPDFNHSIQYNVMPGKLATLFSTFASYNLAQEAVLALGLAALVIWIARRRALSGHAGLLIAAAGLVALAILAPNRAAGASWVDRRFPIMALLCALAALQMRPQVTRRFGLALGAAGLALACVQSAWVSWNWQAMSRNFNAVTEVLSHVEPGARILPVQHDPSLSAKWRAPAGRYIFAVGDATFRHFDAIAVPLRRAFVPNLFAAKGLQPLRVLGDWDARVEHNGGDLASISALRRTLRPDEPTYLRDWRKHFDYVLVLNADMPDQGGPFRPKPELTLVAATRFAELWRIAKPQATAAP